jgi:hypothetical protein
MVRRASSWVGANLLLLHTRRLLATPCRMPVGGPGGGPLQVTLDQQGFDELSTELFQRARLPLDQACWNAGEQLRCTAGWLPMAHSDVQQEPTHHQTKEPW